MAVSVRLVLVHFFRTLCAMKKASKCNSLSLGHVCEDESNSGKGKECVEVSSDEVEYHSCVVK